MPECDSRSHDFSDGSAEPLGPSAAWFELKCRWCGVRMVATLESAGRTVRRTVHIYPATGTNRISKEILVYFFVVLGANSEEMQNDGYRIIDTGRTIHAITPEEPWLS